MIMIYTWEACAGFTTERACSSFFFPFLHALILKSFASIFLHILHTPYLFFGFFFQVLVNRSSFLSRYILSRLFLGLTLEVDR